MSHDIGNPGRSVRCSAMSKARLVITAVIIEGRTQAEVAATYGVSKGWVSKLIARYNAEGDAAFEPRSRRPKTSPGALDSAVVELILRAPQEAGRPPASTPAPTPSPGTSPTTTDTRSRGRPSAVTWPTPDSSSPSRRSDRSPPTSGSKPSMPNETWQSDFTHYRLTHPDGRPGPDVEIITWLDDCTRYALHVTAHHRITGPIVTATFRQSACPARDPGLHAHRQRHGLHRPLRRRPRRTQHASRTNSGACTSSRRTPDPSHPTTCGKVERFQQTMKKWLRAQPRPTSHAPRASVPDRCLRR